jgi:autotransporter-associated beta strand protein
MKIPFRLRSSILVAGMAGVFFPVVEYAATFVWDGGGSSDNWAIAANWNPDIAPSTSATDDVIVFSGATRLTPFQGFSPNIRIQSLQFAAAASAFSVSGLPINLQTGTAAPTIDQSSTSNQAVSAPLNFVNDVTLAGAGAGSLTLGAVSGGGSLTKTSAGTLNFAGAVSIPTIVVSTGTINFAAGSSSTAATVRINAGANFTLNGGTVNTGTGAFFQVGNSAGAAGTATITTGSLTSTESDIGNVAGATGTVTQDGGTHTVSGQLYLGVVATATGNYTLNTGGTLNTAGTRVGFAGTGTFTQNGGAHNLTGALQLGASNAGSGTYNLNGGTLTTSAVTNNSNGAGSSTFNFNGGTLRPNVSTTTFFGPLNTANVQAGGALIDTNGFNVTVAQPLIHAAALGATADGGLQKLGAGTLTLTGVSTYTGPTIALAGTLEVGNGGKIQNSFLQVPAGGTFLLSPGGTYDAGSAVYLNVGGTAGALPSTVNQTGGTMTTVATDLGNIAGNTAVFNQSGGTNTVSTQITVGLNTGAVGTYNLSGTGVLNSPSLTLVGVSTTGFFNQTGGTNNSNQTNLGHNSTGNGTYVLSGGQLNASGYFAVGASGIGLFRQTSGVFTTPGQLYLGFNTGAVGTYEFSAGQATAASVNIGVSGQGTAVQTGGLLSATSPVTIGNNASGVGVYRLAGGVLRANSVQGGAGTATFSFDGGTLQASAATSNLLLNMDTLQVLAGGGKIDTNGFAVTIGSVLSHEVNDATSQQTDGGLTKLGAGNLTLTANNTFNGGVTVAAGTLTVAGDANLGAATGPIAISNGATLAFTGASITTSRNFTLTNASLTPAANGTITYIGSTINGGLLGFNGASTHRLGPGAVINYSTILPNTAVAQVSGTATLTGVTLGGILTQPAGAVLNFNGGFVTAAGTVTVGGTANFAGVEITGRTIISGTLNATVAPLVMGSGAYTTIAAGGHLTAAAGASIELNGARLENGGAQAGILNINRGSVVVGSGTFGAVTVTAGGTFSPGNSPGTTSLDSFTLAGAGAYNFELNSVAVNPGVNQDFLNIGTTLSITATAVNPFVLMISSLTPGNTAGPVTTFASNVPYVFTLATATANITTFSPDKFVIDTSHFLNSLDGGTFALSTSGNQKSLILTFAPIPEPATLAFLLAALPLLAWRRRGQRRGPGAPCRRPAGR